MSNLEIVPIQRGLSQPAAAGHRPLQLPGPGNPAEVCGRLPGPGSVCQEQEPTTNRMKR